MTYDEQRKEIRRVWSNVTRPLKRNEGFRGSSTLVRRWLDDRCELIGVQTFEKLEDRLHIAFTLNFGIYMPELAEGWQARDPPLIPDCQASIRSGDLLAGPPFVGDDRWWRVDEPAHSEVAAREAEEAIGVGLTFFADLRDRQRMREWIARRSGSRDLIAARWIELLDG